MKPRVEVRFGLAEKRAFLWKRHSYNAKEDEFLLNHARSGLLLALQSIGLPQGSKVGVMVYNCHTVMNAVAQAGYEVVFIDVDDGLRIDVEDLRKKSEGLKAIVVTHLFGIVNDVAVLQRDFPQLIVIEDCAHAFGKEIVGDFGVYSIGQGKLPSLGDGGVLVAKNKKYAESVRALYDGLPGYSFLEETKLYAKLWLTDVAHRKWIYGWLTNPMKQNKKPGSGREHIVVKRMSRGVQSMLALGKQGVSQRVSQRLGNANLEMQKLNGNELVINVLCGANAFMLVARTNDPKALKAQYAQKGIETATHFANSIAWAKEFGYRDDCPNAEKLTKELLMIPVY